MLSAQGTSLDQAIQQYKSDIENTKTIATCGHILDGPAAVVKQIENRSLDRMIQLSEKQKEEIGKKNFEEIGKRQSLLKTHKDAEKLLEMFTKLIQHSESTTTFSLNLIDSKEINAFTTIGGYVYLTTGLLDFVDSYDELAFILGHEIAHQDKRHVERKIMKIVLTSQFLELTQMEGFMKVANNIRTTIGAPFDQIDEYEADKQGFSIAKKAGYNPSKFADFFKKMEKVEQRNLLKKLSSTHPFAQDRKKCIENYLQN